MEFVKFYRDELKLKDREAGNLKEWLFRQGVKLVRTRDGMDRKREYRGFRLIRSYDTPHLVP